MSTMELFVEPILIGVLVLAAIACVAPAKYVGEVDMANYAHLGALLAGAYLIGMFYDRFSQILIGRHENHHPHQEQLQVRILTQPEAARHMRYLSSRIRLMRGVTTLVPGILFCASLAIVGADKEERIVGGGVVGALYLSLFLIRIFGEERTGRRNLAWIPAASPPASGSVQAPQPSRSPLSIGRKYSFL